MKFDDIDTRRLLPHWAHDADWIQAAFDKIAKAAFDRAPAIDVPLTMQAIRTLSDSELQAWYVRLGVVEYYPDLSRETREKMLYWCARLYRFLGTPQAVRILCEYVHDGLPMNVEVRDNLAWEGTTLADPQLLDVFDIVINAEDVHITPMLANRIMQNVLRIARNSQALRNIIYRYATRIDVPVSPADAPSAAVTEFVENWAVSDPQMPMVWRYDENILPFETVAPGGTLATGLQYSATGLYAPVVAINDPMATHPDFFGWGTEESAGHVDIVNNTGASKSVMVVSIYHMEAEDAELVTVKNSQNERFNAFKVYKDGAPWWFVVGYAIDGWTNDLAAEGCEEVTGTTDTATGAVGSLVLPTEHAGQYNNVTFSSLRYYVAGKLSNYEGNFANAYGYSQQWYRGTVTWVDRSLGDLSSMIATNNPNNSTRVQQTILRLLFIDSNEYYGYSAWDTGNTNEYSQIESYSYNDGVHTIRFWTSYGAWNRYAPEGRIMIRFLDGTTPFGSLDAFDIVQSYGGTLQKCTPLSRYVIYNAWGSNDGGTITVSASYGAPPTTMRAYRNAYGTAQPISAQGGGFVYDVNGENLTYDSTKVYHIYAIRDGNGNLISVQAPGVVLSDAGNATMYFSNVTGSAIYDVCYFEYYTT